jgi:hypothetical protein
MESRIVYRNSDGVKRTALVDYEQPNKFTVHTEVEMDEVLEGIKRAREDEAARNFPTNRLVARVPMTVYEKSIVEQWDEADWKKWLNDPDNAAFRVWTGQV